MRRLKRAAKWAFSRCADRCSGSPLWMIRTRAGTLRPESSRLRRLADKIDRLNERLLMLFPDHWYDQNDTACRGCGRYNTPGETCYPCDKPSAVVAHASYEDAALQALETRGHVAKVSGTWLCEPGGARRIDV